MPMPESNTVWPPKRFDDVFRLMRIQDALWVGDMSYMRDAFNQDAKARKKNRPRWLANLLQSFNGKGEPEGERRTKLHMPTPADVCTLSSDLLFSEPPRIVLPEATSNDGVSGRTKAQMVLDSLVNSPEFHATLQEAGEFQAALGGVYLRGVWNTDITDHVVVETIPADNALPEFQFGMLQAVTFWSELDSDDNATWRLLERYSPGRIEYALFCGTYTGLGVRLDFGAHPDTRWLVDVVDEESSVAVPDNAFPVVYVPNRKPNTQFRRDSQLRGLGASDFAGQEQVFDEIDEVWSSWMRDVRLAKARLIVPEEYLDSRGVGQGSSFDLDREIYEGVNTLTGPNGQPLGITPQKFQIDTEGHVNAIRALERKAYQRAGYSLDSSGTDEDSGVETATGVKARFTLSERTRDKKTNYWRRIGSFTQTIANINAEVFGTDRVTELPEVRFPAESQIDIESVSRTIQMLDAASAISTQQKVRMAHPEWDGKTVDDEVARILEEKGQKVPDPAIFNGIDDVTEPDEDSDSED